MPRGRRVAHNVTPSPRRVGAPPKTERGFNSGIHIPNGRCLVPYGVIRSRSSRAGPRLRNMANPRISTRGKSSGESLISPVVTDSFIDLPVEKTIMKNGNTNGRFRKHDNEDRALVSDEGESSSGSGTNSVSIMMASPGKRAIDLPSTSHDHSILPGRYDDINLFNLIDGAFFGIPCTAKDIVSLDNLRKLPVACQQHLLRMLPRSDCTNKNDGYLEPTFSALKNEYLSAALVDFNERLYAGEMSPTGVIIEAPSEPKPKSPEPVATSSVERISRVESGLDSKLHLPISHSQTSLPNSQPDVNASGASQEIGNASKKRRRIPWGSSSSNMRTRNGSKGNIETFVNERELLKKDSDNPPLPLLRINITNKQVTVVPRNSIHHNYFNVANVTSNSYIFNGTDAISNGSSDSSISNGAQSSSVVRAIDFAPIFVTK